MTDRSREHFETALAQARDVPMRLLQPMVSYWYGRTLAGANEAALKDFRALEMVLHATLGEEALRTLNGSAGAPPPTR